ncbi:hypothetical protein J5N97_010909 [Dioscorea zingiberensis]|uniref:non-specific serine/threonine protein kinase n=1 Tax=Dioscorea zingiberensis TaxID=325984 RepID=A0A9D5HN01_9LILI|nr:hypothetical protein J5N97_010909 [Dioscorea zingiberensis]
MSLVFLVALLVLLHRAIAQQGFLSIHCCAVQNFKDPGTNITWTSDDYLPKAVGTCKSVSFPSISSSRYTLARVFSADNQRSWCYNIPVVQGQVYLVRTTFLYGPVFRSVDETLFNISIGSTSISQVNSSLRFFEVEGIFVATGNNVNTCLVKDKGNAYISMIELRPLNDNIYLDGDPSSILKLVSRVDLGNKNTSYRFPVDPADRIWASDPNFTRNTALISSNVFLQGVNSSIPLEVLQTAATDDEQLNFQLVGLDTSHENYLVILHFLELNPNIQAGQRKFDIYVNGEKKYDMFDILESRKASNYKAYTLKVKANGFLNISLIKASNTTDYGPICNAFEIFEVHDIAAETVQRDVEAASQLRDTLAKKNQGNQRLRNWSGDPCNPSAWEGLACEEKKHTLVITRLNLSSMGLQGPVPSIISDLKDLKELDLQNNNFSGSIPDSLASLSNLSKLSISCNPQLNSQIPGNLSEKKDLTIDSQGCDGEEQPQSPASLQRSVYFIGSMAGGSVAFALGLGAFLTCFYKRTRQHEDRTHQVMKNPVYMMSNIDIPAGHPIVQCFPLKYIESVTCNYKTMIGEGGFGAVFRGTLPHGEEVAVKVRSATSTQGTREFDNEVTLLSTVRNENLVPLLGYCCENDQQILVYPFMSNGSLQDRLYGEASKRKVLDWPTRLSIALGAARGIMYLHNFAGRCIIHRDIKTSNILLDHSMCAKVADFGFSKYAPQEGDSGASLEIRGTAGYLDPEYYSTQQLSSKSDVFSFGVVLLEIVTGREPLNIQRPHNEWSLVEWAKPFIRESRIDEIVDPSIKGGYHAEAMWRVVETALVCLEPFSTYRPNMTDIVRELEDALIIENNASEYMRSIESIGIGGGGSSRYLSMERKPLPPIPSPIEPSPAYCQILTAPQPR